MPLVTPLGIQLYDNPILCCVLNKSCGFLVYLRGFRGIKEILRVSLGFLGVFWVSLGVSLVFPGANNGVLFNLMGVIISIIGIALVFIWGLLGYPWGCMWFLEFLGLKDAPDMMLFHTYYIQIFFQLTEIEEWLKRDVIRDKSVLKMHPSIIKYITGYKYRDDKKQFIKVYIHGDDKKAENFFKECCKVSEDTHFEFVNVVRSKEENKEVEELKQRERKAPAVDNSTRKQLKQIIQEYGDKIYARYSNVVGIRIGKVRRVGNTIQEHPCLVLYCLDKFLIPFGEKPLPEAIAGWPCDIREDFVRFGICPNRCLASRQNLPDPGCSIGIPSDDSSGSVGFLVESKDPLNTFEFGFLTASHVAIKRFEQLYHDEKLLSMHFLKLNNHFIVHPSWIDNEHIDHKVGKVVESFCGNYGLDKIGLDFALIASSHCRNGGIFRRMVYITEIFKIDLNTCLNENSLIYFSRKHVFVTTSSRKRVVILRSYLVTCHFPNFVQHINSFKHYYCNGFTTKTKVLPKQFTTIAKLNNFIF